MTREEFLNLKDELTKVVLDYEVLQKKIYFLQQSYFIEFSEELEQELYIKIENDAMIGAIALMSEGKTESEIATFLEEKKKFLTQEVSALSLRVKNAEDMAKRCSHYTPTDMQSLDEEFKNYCVFYHPVIKAHSTENERTLYNTLITMYRIGNLSGFRGLLTENKDVFTSTAVLEEEYDSIAKFYQQSITNLSNLIGRALQSFPLNKEAVLISEEGNTREHGLLREKNYNLREINRELHKDFEHHFHYDFQIES